jgi:hypothetical protein
MLKFRGARRQLAATEQPQAGSVLEPAHPETAGRILRDLTSRSTTFKPDEKILGLQRMRVNFGEE